MLIGICISKPIMLDIDTGLRMLSLTDKHDALPLFPTMPSRPICMHVLPETARTWQPVTVVQYFIQYRCNFGYVESRMLLKCQGTRDRSQLKYIIRIVKI